MVASRKNCAIAEKQKPEGGEGLRPITCSNTSYKFMTGVVAKYMREHTMKNEILDEDQLGAVEGVLGTVDQLVIDLIMLYRRSETIPQTTSHFTTIRRRMIKSIMIGC